MEGWCVVPVISRNKSLNQHPAYNRNYTPSIIKVLNKIAYTIVFFIYLFLSTAANMLAHLGNFFSYNCHNGWSDHQPNSINNPNLKKIYKGHLLNCYH